MLAPNQLSSAAEVRRNDGNGGKQMGREKRHLTDRQVEAIRTQYRAANDRRFRNFGFFWQAVALGVAAQAFLFQIMLAASTAIVGRFIAAGLSMAASASALSLMTSQKRYQKVEAGWLDAFETLEQAGFHYKLKHRKNVMKRNHALHKKFPELADRSYTWHIDATRFFQVLFVIFIAAAICVIVLAGVVPSWLSGGPHT